MHLYEHQQKALPKIHKGIILCGRTGSGKSITALAYYYLMNGGSEDFLYGGKYKKMKKPMDLYIITTARKRDKMEWDGDMGPFLIGTNLKEPLYKNKIIVDSWNNVHKYTTIKNAFFIFDEQRVVGYGTWSKSFIKIAKQNEWILLSATPGDTWSDYMAVFIANGFYKNKKDFEDQHVIYSAFTKFRKIDRYVNIHKLMRLREKILVPMEFERKTTQHHTYIYCEYNKKDYIRMQRDMWNVFKDQPVLNSSELCYNLRRLVNMDPSREIAVMDIMDKRNNAIIFYNFDYELDILHKIFEKSSFTVGEWNGHKHQDVPQTKRWVYFVQYTAGAEGWNCTSTDTMIFFSANYSYKIMEQSTGRIDRLNTPFTDLYYYHLSSRAPIDVAIKRAIQTKKKFNETSWIRKNMIKKESKNNGTK